MRIFTSSKILISSIIVCLSLASHLVLADPPQHAPARNYDQNQGHDDDYQRRDDDHDDNNYRKPRRYNDHNDNRDDNSRGHNQAPRYNNQRNGHQQSRNQNYETISCDPNSGNSSKIGSIIGGILGGILGSNIGKGNGKTLATIAGVIVGATIGNTVGSSMDERDRYCAGQALGNAQDNQAVAWTNPDTHQEYTVTPQRTYTRNNGRECRDYSSSVVIDGRREQATGTACKDYSGNWQIIN